MSGGGLRSWAERVDVDTVRNVNDRRPRVSRDGAAPRTFRHIPRGRYERRSTACPKRLLVAQRRSGDPERIALELRAVGAIVDVSFTAGGKMATPGERLQVVQRPHDRLGREKRPDVARCLD